VKVLLVLFNANFAVGILRLSVGKLQLSAQPTFLTHDYTAGRQFFSQKLHSALFLRKED